MDYPKNTPGVGLVNGKFVDENPVAGTPGSLIPASWGNAVTQEIVGAISAAGMAPAEDQTNQLTLAIKQLAKLDPLQRFPVQVYRKNLLINGNFDVWQRGPSNRGPTIGGYIADRFRCDWDGAGINISRQNFALGQTEVPDEPQFFLRWQQVTAGAGSTTHTISQAIESVRTLADKAATVTFWAKADTTRQVTVSFGQYFGVGGSAYASGTIGTFQFKSSWAKYSATFQVPSVAGKSVGTAGGDYLRLTFELPLNVMQTIDLAHVQLEEGPVSTPFEFRTPADELILCQRYFEKTFNQDVPPGDSTGSIAGSLISTVKVGQSSFSSQPLAQWSFKVEKRATPSISLYRPIPNGTLGQWRSGSDEISSANARPYTVSTRGVWVDNFDVALVPQSYYIHATADAEL
ncbi:carbohydrate-binding protein CenC [Pseudomonas sp. 6D_7.1_Bac1]|uniref:carbohydrate-binding protein CenC n=1 Tax=Pseudomonas sp. 6D_7.1_Bac1 TaxID=2971615 RepID=UPI0021CA4882|nr:carbohydrate-binding protein CenC [Pseudomonas sp. 6D_7.1_Bac1]MCU1750432.1 carbohydrate-binding protein CenC [Pseudomonas sp. 6D_7.1_Bac1]